jgi:hypothetical protein
MKLNSNTKIILGALAYVVIAFVVSTLSSYLTMSYYTDPNYFPVWSKIMMPTAGPPPMSFFYYSIAFSFIGGLIASFIYSRVQVVFGKKSVMQKGIRFAIGMFLVSGVSFFLSMYLLINVPLGLLISWLFFNGLLVNLFAGIAIAKILE